jgi:hypothetical protein
VSVVRFFEPPENPSTSFAIVDPGGVVPDMVSGDRRSAPRLAVIVPLDATINKNPAQINDISSSGALVRHENGLVRGLIRLRFSWNGARFNEQVSLVSSRLVGVADERTCYESRLAFQDASDESRIALEHAIATLHDRQLASWIANLEGVERSHSAHEAGCSDNGEYLVCTLVDGIWRRRRVRTPGQPRNGFAIRACIREAEIRRICRAFASSGEDARELLRLFTLHIR